jgi:hypothetical protein
VLHDAIRTYLADPDLARAHGARGREVALERWSVSRFLDDWDRVLAAVTGHTPSPAPLGSTHAAAGAVAVPL